jgi:hypothetical protein
MLNESKDYVNPLMDSKDFEFDNTKVPPFGESKINFVDFNELVSNISCDVQELLEHIFKEELTNNQLETLSTIIQDTIAAGKSANDITSAIIEGLSLDEDKLGNVIYDIWKIIDTYL